MVMPGRVDMACTEGTDSHSDGMAATEQVMDGRMEVSEPMTAMEIATVQVDMVSIRFTASEAMAGDSMAINGTAQKVGRKNRPRVSLGKLNRKNLEYEEKALISVFRNNRLIIGKFCCILFI